MGRPHLESPIHLGPDVVLRKLYREAENQGHHEPQYLNRIRRGQPVESQVLETSLELMSKMLVFLFLLRTSQAPGLKEKAATSSPKKNQSDGMCLHASGPSLARRGE